MIEESCKTEKKGPLSAGLFFVPDAVRRIAQANLTITTYLLLFATAALYLLSPVFHPRLGAIGHNDQRAIASILIALGAAFFAIYYFFQFVSVHLPTWLEYAVWLVVLLGLTSVAISPFPLRALLEVCLYLCLFYAACGIYQYYRTLEHRFVFLALSRLAVAFSLVYAVAFLFSYGTWLLLPEFYCSSCVMPNFDNMRAFNDVQIWLMPFLWYFALQNGAKGARRVLAFVPAVFIATLFFYTYARGATLAVLLAIAFAALRYRTQAIGFARVAAGSMILGWVLNAGLTRLLPTLIDRPSRIDMLDRLGSGTSGRTDLWQVALDMVLQNPLFGIGPQHYAHQLFQKYEHLKPFGSPHNMFLMFLAEWGIVAGSLLSIGILWFVYRVLCGPRNVKNDEGVQEKKVAEAVAISVLVSSLFAGSLLSPFSQMMMVLFAPALLLVNRKSTELHSRTSTQIHKRQYGYAALLLCAALYLFGMTVYDIVVHKDAIFTTTETAYPRYWQNGFFWRY